MNRRSLKSFEEVLRSWVLLQEPFKGCQKVDDKERCQPTGEDSLIGIVRGLL